MVSGKAETASEAGGGTFSRFIVEDRRISGSGGARSSAPLLRTLVLQRQKALFDPLEMRSEEHTSELQSLMRISYAVFCLKTKNMKAQTDRSYKHLKSSH